jgi:hypothetical protein
MGAEIKLKCCLDIARGLEYLQSCVVPIIHRDLRSFNIFVCSQVYFIVKTYSRSRSCR